jgi:hypothetical protein
MPVFLNASGANTDSSQAQRKAIGGAPRKPIASADIEYRGSK